MQKILVATPHLGNMWILAKTLFRNLGIPILIPPYNNKNTMELGVKHSPEFVCFPYKMNLGNMIEALDMGANMIFTPAGDWKHSCR